MSHLPRTPSLAGLRALNRDQRAAAMVEFLLVLTPLLILFLCTIELTRFSIAELMLQRAAGIAARACAVMKDQPRHCDGNSAGDGQSSNQDAQITLAAEEALKPLPTTSLSVAQAKCATNQGGHAPSGWDSLAATARFHCVVPLASAIVCSDIEPAGSPFGKGERTRLISASAKYAHQGASYDCWFSKTFEFVGGATVGGEVDTDVGDVDPWSF